MSHSCTLSTVFSGSKDPVVKYTLVTIGNGLMIHGELPAVDAADVGEGKGMTSVMCEVSQVSGVTVTQTHFLSLSHTHIHTSTRARMFVTTYHTHACVHVLSISHA